MDLSKVFDYIPHDLLSQNGRLWLQGVLSYFSIFIREASKIIRKH